MRILKNRDLSKIVFLEASVISACNQMENSIIITPYNSNKSDRALFGVLNGLKFIANERDIRATLRKMCSVADMYKIYLKENI